MENIKRNGLSSLEKKAFMSKILKPAMSFFKKSPKVTDTVIKPTIGQKLKTGVKWTAGLAGVSGVANYAAGNPIYSPSKNYQPVSQQNNVNEQ